jgi:hypothetical protein
MSNVIINLKMKCNINYKGQNRVIQIEPSVYQGKQMYEVNYDHQFVMVYQEGNKWRQDGDHDYDEEWLNTIGNLIESLPKMNTNSIV